MGPTLFLIYINDIVNATNDVDFTLYADDTSCVITDKEIGNLHTKISQSLNNINSWILANKLRLNTSKSHFMLFQNRSQSFDIAPVWLSYQMINRVKSTIFLGIIIDEHINWKDHINSLSNKISKTCGILRRIRDKLTKEAMLTIYYTLVYSRIIYCIHIWGCTWPTYLSVINKSQRSIIRVITYKKKYESISSTFNDLKLLDTKSIHKYFTILFVFKMLNSNNNLSFIIQDHNVNTRRNKVNLICPTYRTTLFNN